MDQSKIDMFVSQNMNKFNPGQMSEIRTKLSSMDDSKMNAILNLELRDCTTMLIISVLLGCLGIDSFMLGKNGIGILKLLTCGCCGILWIIDIINIKKTTQDFNFQKFNESVSQL